MVEFRSIPNLKEINLAKQQLFTIFWHPQPQNLHHPWLHQDTPVLGAPQPMCWHGPGATPAGKSMAFPWLFPVKKNPAFDPILAETLWFFGFSRYGGFVNWGDPQNTKSSWSNDWMIWRYTYETSIWGTCGIWISPMLLCPQQQRDSGHEFSNSEEHGGRRPRWPGTITRETDWANGNCKKWNAA